MRLSRSGVEAGRSRHRLRGGAVFATLLGPLRAPLAAVALDLRTAQALGLAIPPLALGLANLVIE
jgi:hypothetical protein